MMYHHIILKTNNGRPPLEQGPGIAARPMWFHAVGLLSPVLIIGVFFLGVASAQAGSRDFSATQRGDEIMRLVSYVDPSRMQGQANLAVPLGQGLDLSVEIEQYPYAYVPHNNGNQAPAVFLVHAKVSNSGSQNATNVIVELNNLSGLTLQDNENPVRHPPNLTPGDTYHAYWFVTCLNNCINGGSYTVTANVDGTATTASHSVVAKDVQAVGAGNLPSPSLSGCDAVDNGIFSMTVQYTGLEGKQEVFFGPAGNTDFLPSAYRLVDSRVKLGGQDYDNELYFPIVLNNTAEVTYFFQILESGTDSPLCPYLAYSHNNNLATTFNDYCQTDEFICNPDILSVIEITKTASPMTVEEPGGNVTFNFEVTNNSAEVVTLDSLVDDTYGNLHGQGDCAVPQVLAENGGSYICSISKFVAGSAGETHTNVVTAIVEDDDGDSMSDDDKTTVTIIAGPAPTPVASFTASPTTGSVSLTVTFTDLSTNSPTYWLWTFGDGASTTGQNPTHTYTTTGHYTVTLTVGNPFGEDSMVDTNCITVTELIIQPVYLPLILKGST